MQDEVASFLNRLQIECGQLGIRSVHVLVAVSGGADSVALLRGLVSLRESLQLSVSVAHLNHQLRGTESEADAAWVEALCREMNVPCEVGSEAVREAPNIQRLGLEGTARLARRRFLQRVANQRGCDCIALAHTANDQAETILHHILRGTGLAGLRGMHSQSIDDVGDLHARSERPVVRPLLQIDRLTLEGFLAALGQTYRTDSTNADTTLTRNRIRHELLPQLARDYNPRIQSALLRLAQQAQAVYGEEAELADALVDDALLEATSDHCRLLCHPFAGQPPHRIREAFVRLWRRLDWPRRQMGFSDWERLVRALQPNQAAIILPGTITVRRRDDLLMLSRDCSNVKGPRL